MKMLVVTFLAGLQFIACAAPATKEHIPKRAAPYQVVETKPDANLDQQHAVFAFTFDNATTESKAWVELSCNGVIERFQVDSTYHEITVSPGKYVFQLARNRSYEEIHTDSIAIQPGHRTTIKCWFQLAERQMELKKPVIYLYAEEEQTFEMSIVPNGRLTFTYPQAHAGKWSGSVLPNGMVAVNGTTYPYLFWEGERDLPLQPDFAEGFVVDRTTVIPFLENQLTAMGLNDREKTDFITFWGPIMVQSERGFARFLFNNSYETIASVDIQPVPDNLFRVYLLWTPLENDQHIQPRAQVIPQVKRTGFSVVEWGGSELIQTPENLCSQQ